MPMNQVTTRDFEPLLRVRGGARVRDRLLQLPFVSSARARAYWFSAVPNFGDHLSAAVLHWATGSPPIWVTRFFCGKVLAVGSVLEAAAPNDTVWGSGAIRDAPLVPPPGVSFLAVRGPLTRARVAADVPEVYGDPALLTPLVHNSPVEKKYAIGVVPHYADQAAVTINDPSVAVVDVGRPWREVVDLIRACEIVVSSSLHGLIVAEAYGVPASWVRITDGVKGGGFKFNDYYLSTGRDAQAPAAWKCGLGHAVLRTAPPIQFDPEALIAAAKGIPIPFRT